MATDQRVKDSNDSKDVKYASAIITHLSYFDDQSRELMNEICKKLETYFFIEFKHCFFLEKTFTMQYTMQDLSKIPDDELIKKAMLWLDLKEPPDEIQMARYLAMINNISKIIGNLSQRFSTNYNIQNNCEGSVSDTFKSIVVESEEVALQAMVEHALITFIPILITRLNRN